MRETLLVSAVVVVMLGAARTPVDAATRCVAKTSEGTGANEKVAKFQVYEGLLKSVDWGVWSQWLVDGTTPGYRVSQPTYVCRSGVGLGVSCRGRAKICKI